MLSVNQEIPEELVETEKAVLCPLLAGQMSVSIRVSELQTYSIPARNVQTLIVLRGCFIQIHDGLLVHASDPNTSSRRRCGYVIRYVPTCTYPIQVKNISLTQ